MTKSTRFLLSYSPFVAHQTFPLCYLINTGNFWYFGTANFVLQSPYIKLKLGLNLFCSVSYAFIAENPKLRKSPHTFDTVGRLVDLVELGTTLVQFDCKCVIKFLVVPNGLVGRVADASIHLLLRLMLLFTPELKNALAIAFQTKKLRFYFILLKGDHKMNPRPNTVSLCCKQCPHSTLSRTFNLTKLLLKIVLLLIKTFSFKY